MKFHTGGETEGQIGVPETMITSAISGLLYALFAGQPLIITGMKIVIHINHECFCLMFC